MNTFSSSRLPSQQLFFLHESSHSAINSIQRRRGHSFDLSGIQPLSFKPKYPGDIILSDMRDELSYIKSDIQHLIKSEIENEDLLMMEKLQILNHELRREVNYMKDVEERLMRENRQLQQKTEINITATRISENVTDRKDIRMQPKIKPSTNVKSINQSKTASESKNSTHILDKQLEEYKIKLLQAIENGNQRVAKLQYEKDQLKSDQLQKDKQMLKEMNGLKYENSILKEEIGNFKLEVNIKNKSLNELMSNQQNHLNEDNKLKDKIIKLQQQVINFQKQINILEERLNEKAKELNAYKIQNNNRIDVIKTESNAIIVDIKEQIDALKIENYKYRSEIQMQRSINMESNYAIKQLKKESQKRQEYYLQLQRKQAERENSYQVQNEKQIKEISIQISQLKCDLEESQQKNNKLGNELIQLQNEISVKNIYINQLQQDYENLKKKSESSKKQNDELISRVQSLSVFNEQLLRKMQQTQQILNTNYQLIFQHNQTIFKNSAQIQDYKKDLKKYEDTLESLTKENIKYKTKIIELQQNLKNRTNYLLTLQKQCSQNDPKENQYKSKIKSLESILEEKEDIIYKLQEECRESRTTTTGQSSQNITIQEILRRNTSRDTEMMNSLRSKSEQIIQLRSLMEEYKRKIDFMRNQADVEKLKLTTQERNQKNHYEIDIQNLKSQLESNNRRLDGINKKLESKIGELKRKDQFIQGVIVNKVGRQLQKTEAAYIIEQVDKYFGKNYFDRLLAAEEEIETLKDTLEKLRTSD